MKMQSINTTESPLPHLDRFAFQMLNAIGDLFQIIPAVVPSERADFGKMSREDFQAWQFSHSHCSALIKVSGAFEDL